ncbi:hypothetical protein SAMN06295916_1024 [Polynucleobacter victoriensis]|uniref:Lipoprotein n=2 Tax=Polynucleobacter victoriensis TaxID=2049319 RepID=A0A212TDH2_9BURK|nr:hypothetical protein SAMN06295916_1024 [Polynucleobacter victoriensis]
MLFKLFSSILIGISLVACTPSLDWRTVRSDDLLYEALYPGKPSRAEKTVMFNSQKLTMTMEASRVNATLFAVGVINIPATAKGIDLKVLKDFLQNGMLSNLKTNQAPTPKTISIKTAGQPSYDLPAQEWVIQGLGPDGQQRLLRFRVVQRNLPDGQIQIYQQSILQSLKNNLAVEKILRSDEHEMFFTGFKPY